MFSILHFQIYHCRFQVHTPSIPSVSVVNLLFRGVQFRDIWLKVSRVKDSERLNAESGNFFQNALQNVWVMKCLGIRAGVLFNNEPQKTLLDICNSWHGL